MLPSRAAARVLASELAVFYYALFAWRVRPHALANARAFTLHRESGIAMLFGVLAGVSLGEVLVVHLVVQRWSHTAGWIATAAGLYGLLWLTAMARVIVLRPVLVTEDALVLRFGLLWSARVAFAEIESIRGVGSEAPRGAVKFTGGGEARFLIALHEPVRVDGPYGLGKQARLITLAVDEPREFETALRAAAPAIDIE